MPDAVAGAILPRWRDAPQEEAGRMPESRRYADPEGGFELMVPAGWTTERDEEEGGVELSHPDGAGVLHLIGLEQPADSFPDPAEELYAFLEDRGVELEEDEVEDVPLEGDAEMALCEYVSEDEEEGDGATFWLVAVATAPGRLVFATYFCDAGEEEQERETVRKALGTLRLEEGSA